MAERQPFAVQAAKLSVWAPLVCIATNAAARAGSVGRPAPLVIGIVSLVVYVVGLVSGVVALFGVRKHGREGILGRAVLGVTLNSLIIACVVLCIPVLLRSRRSAQEGPARPKVTPFTFTPVPGFVEYPAGKDAGRDVIHSYIKGDPTDDQPDIVLLIEDLGGMIAKDDMSKFAQGREDVRPLREKWKMHEIDVWEIQEDFGEVTTLTYNAQVPVLPRAIQIRLVGLAERQDELQELLKAVLSHVHGSTNW